MFDQETFSSRLKQLRQANGEKQDELGVALGLARGSISRIESGQRSVSVETLAAIAEHFGVSVDFLMGRSDDSKLK